MAKYCVFCEIIARRSPAAIRYEDKDIIVLDNILKWAPVMLLVIPKKHMTQQELWKDMGRIGEVAIKLGEELCPNGYRMVTNVGLDAMQSQDHAHVHVLGGYHLGHYA